MSSSASPNNPSAPDGPTQQQQQPPRPSSEPRAQSNQPALAAPDSNAVSYPSPSVPPYAYSSSQSQSHPQSQPSQPTPPAQPQPVGQNPPANSANSQQQPVNLPPMRNVELEEQIKQMEEEDEREQSELREQIANLSAEVEQARGEASWWKERCHMLERDVVSERAAKDSALRELRSSISTKDTSRTDAVPLGPRRSPRKRANATEVQPETTQVDATADQVPMGCANCSTSRCQCIDEAFDMADMSNNDDRNKRPHSPLQAAASKRQRSLPDVKTEPEEMEIDFTARFSSNHQVIDSTSSPTTIADPCGFCSNGTPCICAEMAAQEQQERDREESERRAARESNRLAPIHHLSQFTPPPSEGDVSRSDLSLPPPSAMARRSNSCVNGPGTCAQCLSDPNSTLFCKALAASRARGEPSAAQGRDGCCGGNSGGGGCCQSRSSTTDKTNDNSPSITLSCADTYTTLSRHPNFSRASDEPGKWMPKLHTLLNPIEEEPRQAFRDKSVGVDRGEGVVERRPAMEVEAASVMGVLRYFDRRFLDD